MIEDFKLKGKTCFIAGATGKLGEPIAKACAALGAQIIVCDTDHQKCTSLASRLPTSDSQTHTPLSVDLTDQDALHRVLPADLSVDALVHCVGLTSQATLEGYVAPIGEQSLDAWKQALDVNLTSAFVLCQALEAALRKSPTASITFLGSIYAELGPNNGLYENTTMANPLAYGASKGGLLQLMRYLATQWAPSIRVNCVSPGGIEAYQPESFKTKYKAATPLKRMATPQDITGPVTFLSSDAARYITGHNLVVDGGWSAW